MKTFKTIGLLCLILITLWSFTILKKAPVVEIGHLPVPAVQAACHPSASVTNSSEPTVKPLPEYLNKSLEWLAQAQFDNGGWGAGMASAQHVKDPHAVKVDPATTAFSATAFLRAGSTLKEGPYKKNVQKATMYLLDMVENAEANQNNITDIKGTQPQNKLGQNIDLSMTNQFLARLLPTVKNDGQMKSRIEKAIDKCVGLLQKSQQTNGSWNTAGWAPVLNSAMANNALELSHKVGRKVDKKALERSRDYQASNFNKNDDGIATGSAAGIPLYALASTQRATAAEAEEVGKVLEDVEELKPVDVTNYGKTAKVLKDKGYDEKEANRLAYSFTSNRKAKAQLQNDAVLTGFGNNGGEEYLSYMMTSEALVEEKNSQDWDLWHQKMSERFAKVQNQNGSWSGHHCITSPVFCTAAVIMTLTADRDRSLNQTQ